MTATAPPPLRQEFGHECALCTQPCPADDTFCCMGCRNVYTILQESGAIVEGADPRDSELFRRSLALGLVSNAQRPPAPRHCSCPPPPPLPRRPYLHPPQ